MDDGGSTDDSISEGEISVPANEKGRNKRKCSSDVTINISGELSPNSLVALTEFPRCEMLEKQFRKAFNELGSIMEKSKGTIKEQDKGKEDEVEWDDPITYQLEELLTNTLSDNFHDAVKKLVERGHTEEVAEWAVLSSSLFNSNKDAVSNIVDGALALLKLEEYLEMPKHSVFEGLQSLVEYTLLEMINIIREIRPALTVTEAMWCLLLSDLSLACACGLKGIQLAGSFCPEASEESRPTLSDSKSETFGTTQSDSKTTQSDSNKLVNLKPGDPRAQFFRPEITGPAQQLPNNKPSPGELGKEISLPLAHQELKGKFSGGDMDEKSGGGSKKGSIPSLHCKRDLLRQKAIHFEKHYRGRLSKGSFKAKVAAWGSMVLDNTLKSQSGSSSVVIKESFSKLTISEEENQNISSDSQSGKDPVSAVPAVNSKSSDGRTKFEIQAFDPPHPTDYFAKMPFDEILQEYIAQDDKDKTLLMLVPLKRALEIELQGWTNWANEKVMQAAQKLGKDQAELKALRQEKEELEKSIREKQAAEETTMKRLTEMEHALANATSQIELAKCTLYRLEIEHNVLKKELERAKMEAQGSADKVQEAMVKEQGTMKKLQSWEVEKSFVMEALMNLKREIAEIEKILAKAKNRLHQFKLLFKQEEKEKLKAKSRYDSLKKKREDENVLVKVEADKIKEMAQAEKQKCEDSIKNLKAMISDLKMESEKRKIEALSVGYGVPTNPFPKITKRLAVFEEITSYGDVKPERECVMCMAEEISVVFLPCAHQVLCRQCSALHEKQGMKDCPSCRATIKKRIAATFRSN